MGPREGFLVNGPLNSKRDLVPRPEISNQDRRVFHADRCIGLPGVHHETECRAGVIGVGKGEKRGGTSFSKGAL